MPAAGDHTVEARNAKRLKELEAEIAWPKKPSAEASADQIEELAGNF